MIIEHALRASSALVLIVAAVSACAPGVNAPGTTGDASGPSSTDTNSTEELGTSVVRGRVADLSGQAIIDMFVTVSDDYCVPDRTSTTGAFVVERVQDGSQRLITYGETASNGTFASVVLPILVEGDTTVANTVSVPRLDETHPVDLESTEVQTITSSDGLELELQPGSLTFAPFFEAEILVARVPVSDAPAFVPQEVELHDLFVLHPIRSTFDPPAPLRFPPDPELTPGTSVSFYSLDYDTGLLTPVATGVVNDEHAPVTSPGQGLPELTWVAVAIDE